MKIKEILVEYKIDFRLGDTPIYKNPSPSDTEILLSKFAYNSARFLVDSDGNVFIWEAADVIHSDIAQYLSKKYTEVDGFSFSGLWDNKDGSPKYYVVWSDSYLDEKEFSYLLKYDHLVKRMFGDNKVIFDQSMKPDLW